MKAGVFCVFLLLVLPLHATALPAITCHCFTDRLYEPSRPAAADPYFLATTQNSFFAAVFKVDKKSIVIKKQKGTSSDDLWIAYWIASKSGVAPDTLLEAKQMKESWREVLTSLRLTTAALGARFSYSLNATTASARLADAVVEDLFLSYQLLGDKELAAVRHAGASNQELIISTVIAAKTKQPAGQIYREVKNGTKTWGSFLAWANIDSRDMQQEIKQILTLHTQ